MKLFSVRTHWIAICIYRKVLVSARPGRVRAEYPIHLPRPRRVMDVKFSPEVVDLEKAIWADLRHELARAEEGRHG